MNSEARFDIEIEDNRIIIRPVDNNGRKYQPLSISVATAAVLSEALKQAVVEARLKNYN